MKDFFVGLFLVVFTIGGVYSCTEWVENSDWKKAEIKAEQEQRIADAKPRIVSYGADGCKVYASKPGDRWIYSLSCPNAKTTTTNEWTETRQQGKKMISETKTLEVNN